MKNLVMLGIFLLLVGPMAFPEEKQITYDYLELGFLVQTPGGQDLMLAYSMDDLTLRTSLLRGDNSLGFQTEVDWNLGKSNYFKTGPGIFIGYIDSSDGNGTIDLTTNGKSVRGMFFGADYFLNWSIFYSSLGISFNPVNPYYSPALAILFNIGVNYRFLKPGDETYFLSSDTRLDDRFLYSSMNLGFGLGSWVQGDIPSGILISSVMLGSLAVALVASLDSEPFFGNGRRTLEDKNPVVSHITITTLSVGAIYGLIAPWLFKKSVKIDRSPLIESPN